MHYGTPNYAKYAKSSQIGSLETTHIIQIPLILQRLKKVNILGLGLFQQTEVNKKTIRDTDTAFF